MSYRIFNYWISKEKTATKPSAYQPRDLKSIFSWLFPLLNHKDTLAEVTPVDSAIISTIISIKLMNLIRSFKFIWTHLLNQISDLGVEVGYWVVWVSTIRNINNIYCHESTKSTCLAIVLGSFNYCFHYHFGRDINYYFHYSCWGNLRWVIGRDILSIKKGEIIAIKGTRNNRESPKGISTHLIWNKLTKDDN